AILRPVRTTIITFLAVGLAVLGLQLAGGSRAHATTPGTTLGTFVAVTPSMGRGTYEAKVLHWVNVRRGQHGLHALRLSRCTNRVANRWSLHLAATDSFYHQSMMRIMLTCNAYYAGETLAMGGVTPKRIVTLWMHSPEHRKILLSKHPRRIGVGAYPNAQGAWVVAADFMKY
ncbi:MAG: CAP domain-containing protein, partial [Nocardioidaceae bacterium]